MQTMSAGLTAILFLTTNTGVRADQNYFQQFFGEQSFVRKLLWKLKRADELDPKWKVYINLYTPSRQRQFRIR
jgi:hypothetical protein